MPPILIGALRFDFESGWAASQYDGWQFYRRTFNGIASGTQAMDVVAVAPGDACLWLIEVKDYRVHPRENRSGLAEAVAQKTRDTLAGLMAAKVRATVKRELRDAQRAVRCRAVRVVFHLESPSHGEGAEVWRTVRASVQQKIRVLLQAVDPHAQVVSMSRMPGLPWSVSPA